MQSSGFSQGLERVLVFRSTQLSPAESSFRNAQDAFLGKKSCPLGTALETSPWHSPAAGLCPITYPGLWRQAFQKSQLHLQLILVPQWIIYISFSFLLTYLFLKKNTLSEDAFWGFTVISYNHISFYQGRQPPNKVCHPLAAGRGWFRVWCCSEQARESLTLYGWSSSMTLSSSVTEDAGRRG